MGRKICSESAKPIFDGGNRSDDSLSKVLRQGQEIALATDPSLIRKSGGFSVRVLFEGKPIAGLRVSIAREGLKEATICRTRELMNKVVLK